MPILGILIALIYLLSLHHKLGIRTCGKSNGFWTYPRNHLVGAVPPPKASSQNENQPHVSQQVSKLSFEMWIWSTQLSCYNENNSTVSITTHNSFARDWLENY
jgi:hypothetical protein